MLIRSRHALSGFTIIEMTVVLVIVAVLMAIGMPSYRVWIENNKTRTAAESLVSGLNLARSNAVLQNIPVAFNLTALPGSGWTVNPLSCLPAIPPCPALDSRLVSEGSNSNVTVTVTGGATSIQFNNLGRMALPTLSPPATFISLDVSNTGLSTADNRKLRVTVSGGGSVRMCDPSVTNSTDPRYC